MDLFRRTRVGRDINRRYYTAAALQQALARPVVQSLLALLRLRNTHPAFAGTFEAAATAPDRLSLTWTHEERRGPSRCRSCGDDGVDQEFRDRRRQRRGMASPAAGPGMTSDQVRDQNLAIVKTLTYLMFAMFAMTTDSVGVIIPEVIRTLRLSLTAAGTFQYATMTGIAVAGLLLGSLADRFGRRRTVIVGLRSIRRRLFSALGRTHAQVLRRPADAVRTGDRHLQDGCASADRRRVAIDWRTHGDHEHAGRLLRRRRHRRAGCC